MMNQKEFIEWADTKNIDFEFYTEGNSGVNGKVAFFEKGNKENCYMTGSQNGNTDWNKFKKELLTII